MHLNQIKYYILLHDTILINNITNKNKFTINNSLLRSVPTKQIKTLN